jgi:diacylglycerol kinase family enzyme
VIFDGVDHAIDLIRVRTDDREDTYFCALAGIGIDAAIVGETDKDLKRALGSGAYFLSAARHADHPALDARITVDDQPPLRTRAHLVLLGNVGMIQAGIQVIPGARPDDGLLDLMVATPRRTRDWIGLVAGVVARRERPDDRLTRLTGRRVEITVDHPDRYELDGDPQGTCTRLVAEVAPVALVLRVPRHSTR